MLRRHLFRVHNSANTDRGMSRLAISGRWPGALVPGLPRPKVARRGATLEGTVPLVSRRSATRKPQFKQPRPWRAGLFSFRPPGRLLQATLTKYLRSTKRSLACRSMGNR